MSHAYLLKLTPSPLASSSAWLRRLLVDHAPRELAGLALARAANFVQLASACLIGLAFVLVLPFAGTAALCWFAASASRDAAA